MPTCVASVFSQSKLVWVTLCWECNLEGSKERNGKETKGYGWAEDERGMEMWAGVCHRGRKSNIEVWSIEISRRRTLSEGINWAGVVVSLSFRPDVWFVEVDIARVKIFYLTWITLNLFIWGSCLFPLSWLSTWTYILMFSSKFLLEIKNIHFFTFEEPCKNKGEWNWCVPAKCFSSDYKTTS